MDENLYLALLLVLVASAMKVCVGREFKITHVIDAAVELPIDIVFLAFSLALSALVIIPKQEGREGTAVTMVSVLLVAVLVVFLSRLAKTALDRGRKYGVIWLSVISMILASAMLIIAINSIPERLEKPHADSPLIAKPGGLSHE